MWVYGFVSGDAMLHRAIAMMNDARTEKEQLFCELSKEKDKVSTKVFAYFRAYYGADDEKPFPHGFCFTQHT